MLTKPSKNMPLSPAGTPPPITVIPSTSAISLKSDVCVCVARRHVTVLAQARSNEEGSLCLRRCIRAVIRAARAARDASCAASSATAGATVSVAARNLVQRFDIEPFSDFSAK